MSGDDYAPIERERLVQLQKEYRDEVMALDGVLSFGVQFKEAGTGRLSVGASQVTDELKAAVRGIIQSNVSVHYYETSMMYAH